MTVQELIDILSQEDPDTLVILSKEFIFSKDIEGNGFSPLEEITCQFYMAENPWSGYIDTNEGVECVVLWPVN